MTVIVAWNAMPTTEHTFSVAWPFETLHEIESTSYASRRAERHWTVSLAGTHPF